MIPAKSRERKCSTCKHYQASPLWRKGWCRNPLLYDRNTNHLVEADSLACNRTFIDYWEPVDERTVQTTPARGVGSTGMAGARPRIAPSIPLDTVDATGSPVNGADQTPAMGSTPPMRQRKPMFKPLTGRDQGRTPLALVGEDYDELGETDPKITQKMPQIDRPRPGSRPISARERIQQARTLGRPSMQQLSSSRLWLALGAMALVVMAVAAFLLLGRPTTPVAAPASGTATQQAISALPSPTGFGNATPTKNVPRATASVAVVAPPTALAVGGYAKVVGTKGEGLRIRSSPSQEGARVTNVADGKTVHIIDGPTEADGITWWKVDSFNPQSPDMSGWCAQTYLEPTAAP